MAQLFEELGGTSMAFTYSNNNLMIHGFGGTHAYPENPKFYVDITATITRESENVVCKISASLNAMGGSSYFGYSIHFSAGLDDREPTELFSKPNLPNRWAGGRYAGQATIRSYNKTNKCKLQLYLQSTCDCEGGTGTREGARRVIHTIELDAPEYQEYIWVCLQKAGDAQPKWYKEAKPYRLTRTGWEQMKEV